MEKKGKIKTIREAFSNDLPENEDWYQERIKVCESCEYNTDNMEEVGVKLALQNGTLCTNGRSCKACGCCIDEKASQKTETCGLIELGKLPKWEAIKLETKSDKDLDIEILDNTAKKIGLDKTGTHFVLVTNDMINEDLKIDLIVSRKSGLRISKVKASCGCTTPTTERIDDKSIKLKIQLNHTQFSSGVLSTKSVTISYFHMRGVKQAIIKLKVKKI